MRRSVWARLGSLTTIVLIAVSCGGDGDDGATANDRTEANDSAGQPRSADGTDRSDGDGAAGTSAAAPGFANAKTVDGEAFDASTVTGRDAVAWFWAPWCTICRGEAPEVAEFAERYADDVTFVGVAGRGELDAMSAFVAETGTDGFTHVADLDGSIWTAYGVYAQPAFAFIDDNGEVEVFGGAMGGDDLAAKLDELIAT